MTERLLQFIWQFQYFNARELHLETGEPIRIFSAGKPNSDQGADFLDARICVGNVMLAGNIELHVRAADWDRHGHGRDSNYRNIILHVVWENDPGAVNLPTLVLQDRIAKWRLHRYEQWRTRCSRIACGKNAKGVDPEIWRTWKEQLLIGRLQRKSVLIEASLHENGQHWEETFWWLLARNFGLRVNASSFEAIARTLPLSVLKHHRDHLGQLESLLLGQAGLLEKDFHDEYTRDLQKEYRFLRHKYGLKPINQPIFFLRMRPANFPVVRLGQLAALLGTRSNWFALVRETDSLEEVKKSLDCKRLSARMIESIVINTMVPILFTYGRLRKEITSRDKAIRWLAAIFREKNSIIRSWDSLGIGNAHAADSQALIELKTRYCDPGNCLQCSIGRELLRRR